MYTNLANLTRMVFAVTELFRFRICHNHGQWKLSFGPNQQLYKYNV